jgi:hypothetical protein
VTTVLCQSLRVLSFLVTTLPAPSAHCRPDSPFYSPPTSLGDILFHDPYSFGGMFTGCGDLVFSFHVLVITVCGLTYSHYGSYSWLKMVMWCFVLCHGLLVVASREHYMLDVVIGWYTVPMVWICYEWYFPDQLPADWHRGPSNPKRKSNMGLNVAL